MQNFRLIQFTPLQPADLHNPLCIIGMPGIADIGKFAVDQLIGIFNAKNGPTAMVSDVITTKDIQVNYPEILKAIYDVKGGRIPQFADGKYPTEINADFSTDNSNNELIIVLGNLTTEISELRKYRPAVAVETIQKELNNYINIQNETGL